MEVVLSFAQDYEDIILYNMLKDEKDPIRYIDVGANHPVNINVTKFFYDRGGSGINIEPQHEMIELLKEDRPRDINIEAGAGNDEGYLTLHGNGTGASFVSSSDGVECGRKVPIVTLRKVLNEFGNKKETIHFLKIDVEGWEKNVLEGMDFNEYHPLIVVMESTIPDTNVPSWDEWEDILIKANYEFVGMEAQNRYYVSSEQVKIKERFSGKDELLSKYRILMYPEAVGGAVFYRAFFRIYKMKVMKPIRMVREWRKRRSNRQDTMFGE